MDTALEHHETELPVPTILELYIPKWVEMLPQEHPVKEGLIRAARTVLQSGMGMLGESSVEQELEGLEFVQKVTREQQKGGQEQERLCVRVDIDDAWYYQMLSAMAGVEIQGEYQLIAMIRDLTAKKQEYEKAGQALAAARAAGYGVIMPNQEEIRLEEPVLVRQGGKFGVKIRATSPSIHLIRADIETEIAPIVGSEQQANDLIAYIRSSSQEGEGIWETNIFGKSIEQLTEDGIRAKLAQIGEESQQKLQSVMQRIVNETTGGFVCIIL